MKLIRTNAFDFINETYKVYTFDNTDMHFQRKIALA